jgi:hypothetical protein
MRLKRFHSKYFDFKKLKFDWRIINLIHDYTLKDDTKIIKYSTYAQGLHPVFSKKYGSPLPFENNFFTYNIWTNYIGWLYQLYSVDKNYFDNNILPIINSDIIHNTIKEVDDLKELKMLKNDNIKEEAKGTTKDDVKGTKSNPYNEKGDASIGEYYKCGKKVCQRHK